MLQGQGGTWVGGLCRPGSLIRQRVDQWESRNKKRNASIDLFIVSASLIPPGRALRRLVSWNSFRNGGHFGSAGGPFSVLQSGLGHQVSKDAPPPKYSHFLTPIRDLFCWFFPDFLGYVLSIVFCSASGSIFIDFCCSLLALIIIFYICPRFWFRWYFALFRSESFFQRSHCVGSGKAKHKPKE